LAVAAQRHFPVAARRNDGGSAELLHASRQGGGFGPSIKP
jgi:hypothetical protein